RPDGTIAWVGPGAPGAGENLVGPPAEQERVGTPVDLAEERRGLAVEQWQRPSAAREAAPAVLVRPTESLHHSVDGDVRDGRQLHDCGPPFFLGLPSSGQRYSRRRESRSSTLGRQPGADADVQDRRAGARVPGSHRAVLLSLGVPPRTV